MQRERAQLIDDMDGGPGRARGQGGAVHRAMCLYVCVCVCVNICEWVSVRERVTSLELRVVNPVKRVVNRSARA